MPSVNQMFPKKDGEHGRPVNYDGKDFKGDADAFKLQINAGQEKMRKGASDMS